MTRQQWTTPKERQWLVDRKPAFLEAQQNQSTTAFYAQVYEDWVKEFDIPKPTADEIAAAGSQEAAQRLKRKALEKRIFQWFHNNTRPSASASKEGIIPVSKVSKAPAPWQAYQKLYYEKKLKAIVDAEYEAYLKTVIESEKPKTRIQIQTEICRREYEKESKEVKAEVEAYRKTLASDVDSDMTEERRAQKFQEGVNRIQKTLLTYMKTLEEATGWSFCVLAGGPNPQQGGKINRILYETTPEGDSGLTFEGTLGPKEWKLVLTKWNDHLHEVFPENIRKQRSCSNSPTPAPDEAEQVRTEDNSQPSNIQDNTTAPTPAPDTTEQGRVEENSQPRNIEDNTTAPTPVPDATEQGRAEENNSQPRDIQDNMTAPTPAPDTTEQGRAEDSTTAPTPAPDTTELGRAEENSQPGNTIDHQTKRPAEAENVDKDQPVTNAKDASPATTASPEDDYETRKRKNIERNKEILKQIFGENVWDDDSASRGAKGKKGKGKTKGQKSADIVLELQGAVHDSPKANVSSKTDPIHQNANAQDVRKDCEAEDGSREREGRKECGAEDGTPMDVDQTSINTSSADNEMGVEVSPPSSPSGNIPRTESDHDKATIDPNIPKTPAVSAPTTTTDDDQPSATARAAQPEGTEGQLGAACGGHSPGQGFPQNGNLDGVDNSATSSITSASTVPLLPANEGLQATSSSTLSSGQDVSTHSEVGALPAALDLAPLAVHSDSQTGGQTTCPSANPPPVAEAAILIAPSAAAHSPSNTAVHSPLRDSQPPVPSLLAPPPATEATPPATSAATTEANAKYVPDSNINLDTWSAAGYVTDEETFARLPGMCDRASWKALVQTWSVFEQSFRNNGAIPTRPRPAEIASWMKYNRKFNRLPKIVKPSDFIVSWRQWWMAMQPDWRAQDTNWPPSRDVPPGRHWSKIAHTGPNGVFLLIISLGWWGKMVGAGNADEAEFEAAVGDVTWVLSNIIGHSPNVPAKRSLVEKVSSEERPSKRGRMSL